MDKLNQLLQALPGYGILTTEMKQGALDLSLIPDPDGVWPGQPGYVTTYDPYYAALLLVGILQAQPVVTSAGSEGTSVTATPPDWKALVSSWMSLSVVAQATGNGILNRVAIPEGPHVRHTNMHDGGDSYNGDIDTDLG